MFSKITEDPFALPDLYKEKIFKQARDLGYNDESAASNGGEGENMVNDLLEGESEKSEKKAAPQKEPEE